MADKRISELDAATSVSGTDDIPCRQGGANARFTPSQLVTYLSGTFVAQAGQSSGQSLVLNGTSAHDTPTFGSELLTTDGWTVGSGWSESPDDTFTHTSGTSTLSHNATISGSGKYWLTFFIENETAGSLSISLGGKTVSGITSFSDFIIGFVASNTDFLTITPTDDFNGKIYSISLKEITSTSSPLVSFKSSNGSTYFQFRGNYASLSMYYGNQSGQYGFGNSNIAIGLYSQRYTISGYHNSSFGNYSQYNLVSGKYNTCVGESAQRSLTYGSYNLSIGEGSLYNCTTGEGNVTIGYRAGYSETGSNKLYIENSSSSTPLIYGEFDNDLVRIYGQLYARKTTEQFRLEYDANNYASFTVSSAGILTLTTSANKIALGTSRTPASATAAGTAGEICWDADYLYVCVAANTWKRATLSTWT